MGSPPGTPRTLVYRYRGIYHTHYSILGLPKRLAPVSAVVVEKKTHGHIPQPLSKAASFALCLLCCFLLCCVNVLFLDVCKSSLKFQAFINFFSF